MANTTNFGWETPDDTDLVKDGAAAIRTLGSAIDTSLVDLKGGTTGQVLSKNSNTDMDFTWSSVDPLTILDAKGDLISATAADTPARLAVGADGTYLQADSTTSTGLKWGSVSAGGMTLLSTTTLSGTTTTVSSISGSYTDLIILVQGAVFGTGGSNIRILVNGSTSNIYGSAYFNDNGSATALNMSNEMIKGLSDALNTGGNNVAFVRINNYANTSYYKAFTTSSGGDRSPAGQKGGLIGGGVIQTTSAITSIGVSTANSYTFSAGQLLIYGVK